MPHGRLHITLVTLYPSCLACNGKAMLLLRNPFIPYAFTAFIKFSALCGLIEIRVFNYSKPLTRDWYFLIVSPFQ